MQKNQNKKWTVKKRFVSCNNERFSMLNRCSSEMSKKNFVCLKKQCLTDIKVFFLA